jgi:hypothetical protein
VGGTATHGKYVLNQAIACESDVKSRVGTNGLLMNKLPIAFVTEDTTASVASPLA